MSKDKAIKIQLDADIIDGIEASVDAVSIIVVCREYCSAPLLPLNIKAKALLPTGSAREIIIKFNESFANAEGDLEVKYDGTIGQLVGEFGSVKTSSFKFTPIELVKKLPPGVGETINYRANIAANAYKVQERVFFYGSDTIYVQPSVAANNCSATLTLVGTIRP